MASTSHQTIHLTERVARVCKLAEGDIEFLLSEHASHLDIRPTHRRGRYMLMSRGYVGTIALPSCRLLIRPKIPLANFFYLLDSENPILLADDQIDAGRATVFLDVLARRLAHLMQEQSARGLHRGYRRRQQQGSFLQGQLDVPSQMRISPARKNVLASEFDDFTVDVPVNQIPRTLAEQLLHLPLLHPVSRDALHGALQAFQEVTPLPMCERTLEEITLDRLNEHYRPLLDLCRLLFEGLSTTGAGGQFTFPAFLINMEQVFERCCTRRLERAVAGSDRFRIKAQFSTAAHVPQPDLPVLTMRPDVVLFDRDRPVLVLDMKWKSSPFVRSDLYQILSYCAVLGCRRGFLVYPGSHNKMWNYSFRPNSLHVTLRKLRVTGSPDECEQSLRELVQFILREGDTYSV